MKLRRKRLASAHLLLWVVWVLASGCSGEEVVPLGCVKRLNVHRLIPEVVPSSVRTQSWKSEGIGDLEKIHPDAQRVRDKFGVPTPPVYPYHSTHQFRFSLEAGHVTQVFGDLCDRIESALTESCDSVRREDLWMSCSFWTRNKGLHGTFDVLPADEEAARRVLIVVASEW